MRLGVDWGEARIGVAACDRDGLMAFGVATVTAGDSALDELAALVAEYEPIEVVLGLPRTMAGTEGIAAEKIRARADELAGRITVPVRLVDERLTTVTASRQLRAGGKSAKRQRSVIDRAAAAEILNGALEREKATGEPPGEILGGQQLPSSELNDEGYHT
ncbi:Holliday junction resolvase RuvX [Enemella sp. A6]|uniref:Holliday junction resolvase RuvX n=1 Tax=Enemella sp. A6 TaxID=3440152 RepID=UPI003EB6C188